MTMLRIGQNGSINEDKVESITGYIVVVNLSAEHDVVGHFIDNPETTLWKIFIIVRFRTLDAYYDVSYCVHVVSSGNRKMIAEMADRLCSLQKSDEFKLLYDKIMQDMIPQVRCNHNESLEHVLEKNMQDENNAVCQTVVDMIVKTCNEVVTEFKNKKN